MLRRPSSSSEVRGGALIFRKLRVASGRRSSGLASAFPQGFGIFTMQGCSVSSRLRGIRTRDAPNSISSKATILIAYLCNLWYNYERRVTALPSKSYMGSGGDSAKPMRRSNVNIATEMKSYQLGGTGFTGMFASNDAARGRRPGVLVIHGGAGLDDHAKGRA